MLHNHLQAFYLSFTRLLSCHFVEHFFQLAALLSDKRLNHLLFFYLVELFFIFFELKFNLLHALVGFVLLIAGVTLIMIFSGNNQIQLGIAIQKLMT